MDQLPSEAGRGGTLIVPASIRHSDRVTGWMVLKWGNSGGTLGKFVPLLRQPVPTSYCMFLEQRQLVNLSANKARALQGCSAKFQTRPNSPRLRTNDFCFQGQF